MAWLGMAIFVVTFLVVAHRAGWSNREIPMPAWSLPFVFVAWVFIITGSVMASGEGDDRD